MSHTLIITNLETQLSQRLEKLWKIFSWCSSILISIIGATVLASHSGKIKLTWVGCSIISVVIIILTTYAYLWIKENLEFERKIRNEIDKIFEKEFNYYQLKSLRPDRAKFGYKSVIFLLGTVALISTWLNLLTVL